ncbi:hypothetical protein [Oceaniglobus trochenteri]|uniref:hypothetical protein n=1 Tax=Oceaniglobus trochenteri TaxID=2763260 RepID=UPI001CFFF379|nr:hypothetical protein [Oceaniglobus trochenteri]
MTAQAAYGLALAVSLAGSAAHAGEARDAIRAFNAHCFTKGMTQEQAERRMRETSGTPASAPLPFTLTFYDTTIAPAPGAHPGTDRRCEVTFDGDHTAEAIAALREQMQTPPVFGTAGMLPPTHAPEAGTALIEGRDLPRGRRAVVHVTLRNGRTAIGVDRLSPEVN